MFVANFLLFFILTKLLVEQYISGEFSSISFEFILGDFWFCSFININISKTLEFDIVVLNLFFYFSFKFTLSDFWFCSLININICKTLEFDIAVLNLFLFTPGDFWFCSFININISKTLEFDIVVLNLFFYFCFKFTLGNFWFCSFINSKTSVKVASPMLLLVWNTSISQWALVFNWLIRLIRLIDELTNWLIDTYLKKITKLLRHTRFANFATK